MLKFSHKALISFSGILWMAVGTGLLSLGLKLTTFAAKHPEAAFHPLIQAISPLFEEKENSAVFLIALGLFIGFFKGRFVLRKSAERIANRIQMLPNPSPIHKIYNRPYYILLGSMILMGICLNYFGAPKDVRGTIDIAIGSALIHGAMRSLRFAAAVPLSAECKESCS